ISSQFGSIVFAVKWILHKIIYRHFRKWKKNAGNVVLPHTCYGITLKILKSQLVVLIS
ncbi:hypothetical protein L9F63_007830, partial [Diploptera punctata]